MHGTGMSNAFCTRMHTEDFNIIVRYQDLGIYRL